MYVAATTCDFLDQIELPPLCCESEADTHDSYVARWQNDAFKHGFEANARQSKSSMTSSRMRVKRSSRTRRAASRPTFSARMTAKSVSGGGSSDSDGPPQDHQNVFNNFAIKPSFTFRARGVK